MGRGAGIARVCGAVASLAERSIDERFQPDVRAALGEAEFERELAEGRRLSPEDAVALGLEVATASRSTGTRLSPST